MTEGNSTNNNFDELPSAEEFCLTDPLYQKFRFDKKLPNPFFSLEHTKDAIDCFCPGCGSHSVFNRVGEAG